MFSIDQNLDGYRVLADLLSELREAVFASLKRVHGDSWYENGAFRAIRDRLIARKEEEASIDWYSDEYEELIRFTDFTDLLAFLEEDPDLLPRLRSIAPSSELLHARFLELETLRHKLSLAREITESELAFLTAFHRRYKQMADRDAGAAADGAETGATEAMANPDGQSADETGQPAEPAPAPTPAKDEPPSPPTVGSRAAPPPGESAPTGRTEPATATRESATPRLKDSLAEGDDRAILRQLYMEVTKLSDELFKPGEDAYPTVWPVVRRSDWYEAHFSELGLQSLSSFYELLEQAMEYKSIHGEEADMHTFLKDKNFARVLLGLRDMFQKVGV